MKTLLYSLILRTCGLTAVFILSCAASASATDWTPDKTERVDQLISYIRTASNSVDPLPASGLSIAIGLNDQLVLAKGYGEARPGVPANEHTVYRIGSITKQFTAAAILRLIENTREHPSANDELSLHTPVSSIFENARWTPGDTPPITVRNLLTMTSSLPNFTSFPIAGTDPFAAISAQKLLAVIENFSPHQVPDDFEYNNTGYFLLAQVIERVVGGFLHSPDDYRHYLRTTFFNPLQMNDSGFFEDSTTNKNAALPTYRRRPPFTQPDWLEGSADMTSSAVDLFRWNVALMDEKAVDARIHDAMLSDATRVGPQDWYGMGLFVRHKDDFDEFAHSGIVPGFTSFNAVFKNKKDNTRVSVTLLSNKDGFKNLDSLATEIFYLAAGH